MDLPRVRSVFHPGFFTESAEEAERGAMTLRRAEVDKYMAMGSRVLQGDMAGVSSGVRHKRGGGVFFFFVLWSLLLTRNTPGLLAGGCGAVHLFFLLLAGKLSTANNSSFVH